MIALVLLHFFGSSHREWDGVIGRIGTERKIFCFDLPGFGDAARLAPEDVAGMADFVDARIAAAGLGDCVIVGHSMSGKVAALLASRMPDYLRGLVLVTASPPSPEPMTTSARERLLAFDGSREAAGSYIDGITAKRLPDDVREIAVEDAMRASPAAWNAWVVRGSREDCSAAVGIVGLPVLVIAAASDPSLGEKVQRAQVMPHFPKAHLVVIEGGHALPLENATEVHRALDGFLLRMDASRRAAKREGETSTRALG